MTKNRFPAGWDEMRVRRVLEHYEAQTEEEAVAEDEARFESSRGTAMIIPHDLLSQVRALLARHAAS